MQMQPQGFDNDSFSQAQPNPFAAAAIQQPMQQQQMQPQYSQQMQPQYSQPMQPQYSQPAPAAPAPAPAASLNPFDLF